MESKRRMLLSGLAGLIAMPPTQSAASVQRSPSDRHPRLVLGVGTAGSALVKKALLKGVLSGSEPVWVIDRVSQSDRDQARIRALGTAPLSSSATSDLLVVAALGGRDAARLSRAFVSHWPNIARAARRTAIFIVPFDFEGRRRDAAVDQMVGVNPLFHSVTVVDNQRAVGDASESLAVVHARSDVAVFAALRRYILN